MEGSWERQLNTPQRGCWLGGGGDEARGRTAQSQPKRALQKDRRQGAKHLESERWAQYLPPGPCSLWKPWEPSPSLSAGRRKPVLPDGDLEGPCSKPTSGWRQGI